ncbi:MAG TPA: hypothetical protein VMQ44_03290, partial [Candidatus Saccharimonadales bacterium]|nr:hypothetical protein [Candidatus Saccharimonadales bacterium]
MQELANSGWTSGCIVGSVTVLAGHITKSPGGSGKLTLRSGSSPSNTIFGTAVTDPAAMVFLGQCYTREPNGNVVWTQTLVDSLEVGGTWATGTQRWDAVYATVEYYLPNLSFGTANSALVFGGQMTDDAGTFNDYPAKSSSHNRRNFTGQYSRLDLNVTGSSCNAQLYAAGNYAYVSVDGGAEVQLTFSGTSAFCWVPVFTGLSDTLHTVSLYTKSSTNIFYIDKDNSLNVMGAAPAVSAFPNYVAPTWIDSYFTAFRLSPPFTSGANNSDQFIKATSQGHVTYQNYGEDAFVKFRATCTSIYMWTYRNLTSYKVAVDGVWQSAPITTANDLTWGWTQLATGLDGTAEHEYRVQVVYTPQDVVNHKAYFHSFMCPGGSGVNVSQTWPAQDFWGFFGDSITLSCT